MKKNKDLFFGGILAVSGLILFFLIMTRSFAAAGKLGEGYRYLKEADLSQAVTGTVYYDDGYYGVIGFGINNDPADPEREAFMASFLESSLRSVDTRVFSCGVLYTMIISAFFAYFLYVRYGENRRRRITAVLLSCAAVFGLYTGLLAVRFGMEKVPFYLPAGHALLSFITGIFALCGGNCALAALLRNGRFKKFIALLAIPSLIVLFMASFVMEAGLYSDRYLDSFDYVAEIDPRVLDEDFEDAYYDDQKNVMVVGGTEYKPERADNPDYAQGGSRLMAYAEEVLNPYSGSVLLMSEQETGAKAGLLAEILYMLKAVFWTALAFYLPEKHSA